MKTKTLVTWGIIIVLIGLALLSFWQYNKNKRIKNEVSELNKKVNQQERQLSETVQADELSNSIRKKLAEQQVSEMDIKFYKVDQ